MQSNDTNFLIKINSDLNTIIINEANGYLHIVSYYNGI